MNSQTTTKIIPKQSFPSSKKDKFLTRNLQISYSNQLPLRPLRQVLIKRVYLKKFIDERYDEDNLNEQVYRLFKSNKLLKTLKHMQLAGLSSSYGQEMLKNAKSLKSLSMQGNSDPISLRRILLTLKRLPPLKIQQIKFDITRPHLPPCNKDLYNLAKCVRRLPRLQSFKRWFCFTTSKIQNYVSKELETYNKAASRLKNMKKMKFFADNDDLFGLQTAMRGNRRFPKIDGLRIFLSDDELPDYERLVLLNNENDSNSRTDSDEENLDQEIHLDQPDNQNLPRNPFARGRMIRMLRRTNPDFTKEDVQKLQKEEMKPFFRYQLFPNLKRLDLRFENEYVLGSFVIAGFRCLKNLEHLKIEWPDFRSKGSFYLFKGLLQLPMLKKFSLHTPFIKSKEWELLEEFLKDQNKLETLSLSLKEIYLMKRPPAQEYSIKQQTCLTNIIKNFQDKPFLKNLKLISNSWPLETLSQGLSHLTTKNQFTILKIQAQTESNIPQENSQKRIESLCHFIKNQSDSLRKLYISPNFSVEDEIFTCLEAVSKLSLLRELKLTISPINRIEKPEKWNPHVATYLAKLEHLESSSITFHQLFQSPYESFEWFEKFLKTLSSLKNLRELSLNLSIYYHAPENVPENFPERMIDIIKELKNLKKISMHSYYSSIPTDAVEKIRERQDTRCDLMF